MQLMANHKTKLELAWIGKENRPKLEPRILIEEPEKSYHDDYSLEIKNLPMKAPEPEIAKEDRGVKGARTKEERRKLAPDQSSLFDWSEGKEGKP
ncbi:MAG: hypothetical protein WAX69_20850 [Victivallales bacterium]